MRVLSDEDVASLLSLSELLPVVETAFRKQRRGEVERPERPHFPVGIGLDGVDSGMDHDSGADDDRDGHDPTDPWGTGLAMPAYIHGDETYATKLVGVHPDNPARGLPTVHAQLVVTAAQTGVPLAVMAAERITNARTGCIGGLAARDLAVGDGAVTLGVLGAGAQARWQIRAIAATRGVEQLRVYSPNSREAFADERREEGFDAEAVATPAEAVADADVVVTATTSTEPVFPGDALADDALVIAVGAYTAEMREIDGTTMERADRVFADVPEEVAEIGDVAGNDVAPERLEPLADVFAGVQGRTREDGVIVVESVGTAVLDAATGDYLYERAESDGVGAGVTL
jgi:alanine dehydrogenase